MALDWENLNNYSNPIYQFDQFQDPNELLLPTETELSCLDSTPPTLFQIDYHNPLFNYDLITLNPPLYPYLDFPPSMNLPTEENFPYEKDYYTQFLPCFNNNHNYNFVYNNYDGDSIRSNNNNINYNNNGSNKVRVISAQSKAARERRRKITEKTQELSKLVPGGNKMNTAQMLQSAFKYVKFLQAQLGVLQSLQILQKEREKRANLSNLPILASQLVQEKLYAKEKCLVPLDILPIIEEHCDFQINPFVFL